MTNTAFDRCLSTGLRSPDGPRPGRNIFGEGFGVKVSVDDEDSAGDAFAKLGAFLPVKCPPEASRFDRGPILG